MAMCSSSARTPGGGGGLEYQWSGELGLGTEEADSWLLKLAVVDGHMDPELAWANSTLCGTACLLELSGSLDQGAYDQCQLCTHLPGDMWGGRGKGQRSGSESLVSKNSFLQQATCSQHRFNKVNRGGIAQCSLHGDFTQ